MQPDCQVTDKIMPDFLLKKRKIKEEMKIILAQYFEIFQISSSGKIL